MKKQILVAAITSASALVFSSALAADTLTLYGTARVGLFSVSPGGDAASYMTTHKTYGSTRWGITGSEDLGNGLGGVFKVESTWGNSFGSDAGSSSPVGDRHSYVGVKTASAGTFLLGRTWDSSYSAIGFTDIGNIVNGSIFVGPGRTGGSLYWMSPNWSGLTVGLNYNGDATGGSLGTGGKKQPVVSLGVKYAADSFTVGLGYSQNKTHTNAAGTEVATGTFTGLAANYKLDLSGFKMTPFLSYQKLEVAPAVGESDVTTVLGLGSTFAFAGGNVGLMYSVQQDAEVAGVEVKESGATKIGLDYRYPLSYRTSIGFGYDSVDNGVAIPEAVGLTGADGTIGAKSSQFGVAVYHSF